MTRATGYGEGPPGGQRRRDHSAGTGTGRKWVTGEARAQNPAGAF